jgi:hypothetical protein
MSAEKDFVILTISPTDKHLVYLRKHYKGGFTKAGKRQAERIVRTRYSWEARGFKTYEDAASFILDVMNEGFGWRFQLSIIERTQTLVKS